MIAIGEYTISALNDLDYYEVTSSDSMVVIEDENFTPEAVTFTSKHRLGNGNLEAYSGRFKIETSKDGETWETKYTSSGNESTVEYELPSALEDKVLYLFRKSVGGDRAIEEIVGGSVVWNQLALFYDNTKTSRGMTLTVKDNILTYSGTPESGNTGYIDVHTQGDVSNFTIGHRYLIHSVDTNTNNRMTYVVINKPYTEIPDASSISRRCAIYTPTDLPTYLIWRIWVDDVIGQQISGEAKVIITDLTTMFGTQIADYIYSLEQSSAGSGIAKLRSWGFFTKDYYPYCLPTIRSVSGLVEKRYVGWNQWDEEWESGSINGTTGVEVVNSSWSRSDFIDVLPDTTYYFNVEGVDSTHYYYVFGYDADKNYIGAVANETISATGTTQNQCRYVRFQYKRPIDEVVNYKICINISDPTKNGTYEPYEVNTYSLDSSLELRGIFKLDSDNNLYADGDVYPSDGKVKNRYDIVDLGTLNWYKSTSPQRFESTTSISGAKYLSDNIAFNGLCPIYTIYSLNECSSYDNSMYMSSSGMLRIYDSSRYSMSASDFKAAMSGVYLLYEKATPTTSTALPYHTPQELSEYGTEEFVTTAIIPVGHNTKYPTNIKNIRCSLYKPNATPSTTTLLDQITVPIVSGLQYQPFVQRTVFEWALSSSSTELNENTTWAEQKPKPTQAQPYLWERSRNDYSNGTHTYSNAHCDVTISGVISDVDNVKGQITNKVWQSDITTSINSYDNTTVSTIRDRVSTTEQNISGITTRVGTVESTTGSLGTRMTAAESSISQNADNIALKVSKDGVISSINQSPESITISADKVNIAGSTAFTSLNSQVTAIQNETNQKSELIRGTQTAATYSWTGTSTTISQLTDGMEIRYWLPFSVGGGTVSGSYSYYDGSKTTTGTNTGVGLTLTLKNGTLTEEIPVYYGSMSRLTSHYGYGNIIRMIYRENVRVNNGNTTYYTVAKGFWCDANYDANSNYVQYSTAVTSGADNGVYQYSLIMRDSADTWVSIATTNGTGTSKSAYTGGLYYDKVLYHSSSSNYASNKTTSTVYDSIGFDLRYSTNCGTTLTNRKPVYLVGTINNTDKRFYLDTAQWYTQTVPTSADGKTYIYIGEAYSSYQVWLATENKAYQYYNGRFITLEEIKDLEAMSWINSTGQNAADIIASWATDATSATTTINGGLIQTHTIQASHLATNAIMSNNYQASQNANSPYSVTGSFLNLDNGNFYTPNFGLDNVNGNAYFNGEITATSGQIGDDTSNHWQIGTVVDFNGNQSAAIESNGTSYIQSGDWMISNNRIDTRHYDNQRKYTYLYEDGVYWDFGLHTPSLTSSNDYENNFIYIRNHESTIPTLEGAWNYVFRVDRNGMIYINGLSLDEKYASIDGVSSAYLPTTGGSVTGNLSVGGNLSVTGTITGLKNLSINGKTYNGSSAVTVGTIGAAYGGTGQTSLINSANALINALDTGSSTPVDNDYYISQYVNGGTTTKTYHRRPMSALWLYIKGKINADTNLYTDKFVPKTGGEFTGAVTVSDALIADEITSGNLIVNGVGRFTNGIYGDLTGNASTATVAAKVADSGNGQATTFSYSKSGLSTTSDIAVWDGYELRKITPANLKTSLSLVKGDVGLGNVDNTADANKVVKGVSGIAGITNSNRHVWFSDTSPETSRNYDDDFMYNPNTNVLTVGSITGNAASATKLQTARNITIGNKTNSFDGSSAISYSLLDIGAVSRTDELQTTNPFAPSSLRGMYISKIDNAFYAADKRWNVNMTNVGSGSISDLFDGSYDSCVHILDGKTSVLTFDFSTESNGYFPGYPYGYILVSFYFAAKPTSVSGRVYCNYASHGIGWHDISFMPINDNTTNAIVYRSVHQGYYQISSLEITIVGDTTNSYGKTQVTQVEMHLDRPDSSRNPFITKYAPETLYYALTAPKFIGTLEGNATSATTATKLNSTRSFTIGKTAKNVDWSGAVSFSQAEISDNASTSAAGWMSKDDKTKLNGIEANAQVNTITGVKGNSESSYRTGDVNITASNIGLGNLTNNKQVKGLSSGTTSGHLVTWGSDGYTVADSGIASGSVTTKITLSGTDYSASSNTITITKANLQSAVQDTSLVLMTAAERSKLSSIQVSEGGTIDFSGVTASAPITATVNQTTKAVNITHNTSGVTAGTYRSVTVNTYGHVTAGTNPTTLSGYGITDAKIASGVITLGSNTITPLTASSTLSGSKVSGTVPSATNDSDGNAINTTYLKLSGGTMTGGLEISGHIAGDSSTTTGHGLYSGGGYHNAYNNIILHGDATTGSSGIAFVSDKGIGTNINAPSDRAFIQFHPCGITTATAEGTAPTIATSGEANRLVIGVGNDATDEIWLQAPSTAGIKHQLGATTYTIPSLVTTTTTANYPVITSTQAGLLNYNSSITMNGGTITATTFSGALSGNATTATKFSSNRSIALTGDVTGSAFSNGESGWSIATTVGDDSHNHTEFTLVPKTHKTYESTSYYATTGSWEATSWYFFSIKPDSWTKPWKIKFKIRSYCPSYTNVDSITESVIHGRADGITYSNYTERYDYGHYYIPIYPLKKAGYDAGYGHAIGISILYGTNYTNSAYYRTFELDYYSCENCTVTILDTPVKWADWTGNSTTNYNGLTSLDAITRGYTESGDRNDPSYQQKEYYASRTAYKFLGRYQLLLTRPDGKVFPVNTTDNNISTTKTYDTDTEFDPFGQIFYHWTGGTTAINTNVGNDRLYNQAMMDLRYAFNVGGNGATSLITARQPFYLVAVPQSNGMAKIHSSGFTQILPTSDDGLIYIYLGMIYEDTNPYRLNLTLHHPIYWYKDGAIRQYIQRAESANTAVKLSSTPNNTTTFLRGDNTWSNLLTGSISISKAGECGVEVINSQATNPNQVAFIVGSSGNGGIYSRKHYKWIVYSDASGNVVLNGNANTATSATKATQDGSGNTITSYYVTLSTNQTISGAKTFSSAVTFANNTWNLMGDDAYIGDCNAAGKLGIKGKNGATGIRFVPYSGSTNNDITIDGTGNLTATGNLIQQGTVTVGSHAKLTYNENLECLEFSFV